MQLLQFIVAHLGSFTLFLILWILFDNIKDVVVCWLKQPTKQEEERTEQMRIQLDLECVKRGVMNPQDVRDALADGETEPVATPYLAYRGEPGPKDTRIIPPPTM